MSTPTIVPNITLTATLDDQTGQPVLKGQLIITLCGFGLELPKIVGAAMYAKVGPVEFTLPTGETQGGGIKLWGNDQITPSGTFYAIAVVDDKKNVIQTNMYQFTGSQVLDLSDAVPILPSPGTPTIPPFQFATYDVWLVNNEMAEQQPMNFEQIMAFAQANSINVPPNFTSLPPNARFSGAPPSNVYTLTRNAYNNSLILLAYNGNLLLPNMHYTLNGRTITLAFTTWNGDNLYAIYVATTFN